MEEVQTAVLGGRAVARASWQCAVALGHNPVRLLHAHGLVCSSWPRIPSASWRSRPRRMRSAPSRWGGQRENDERGPSPMLCFCTAQRGGWGCTVAITHAGGSL